MGLILVSSGAVARFAVGNDDDPAAGTPMFFGRELESPEGDIAEPGARFAGGNSSCATAITMSERNRARKKRLSIQGTGS